MSSLCTYDYDMIKPFNEEGTAVSDKLMKHLEEDYRIIKWRLLKDHATAGPLFFTQKLV